jgi:hypothetical protein
MMKITSQDSLKLQFFILHGGNPQTEGIAWKAQDQTAQNKNIVTNKRQDRTVYSTTQRSPNGSHTEVNGHGLRNRILISCKVWIAFSSPRHQQPKDLFSLACMGTMLTTF